MQWRSRRLIFGNVVVFLCLLWNFCYERMKLRSERGLCYGMRVREEMKREKERS